MKFSTAPSLWKVIRLLEKEEPYNSKIKLLIYVFTVILELILLYTIKHGNIRAHFHYILCKPLPQDTFINVKSCIQHTLYPALSKN